MSIQKIPNNTLTLKAHRNSYTPLEGHEDMFAKIVYDPVMAQALSGIQVVIPELNGREYIVIAVSGAEVVNIPLSTHSSRYEIWNESGLYNIYVYENSPAISASNLRSHGMPVERYYATEAKVESLQIIADVGDPSFNVRIINRYVEE
jgi:hypothetical protein